MLGLAPLSVFAQSTAVPGVGASVAPVQELPQLPPPPRLELRSPTRIEQDDLESRLAGLVSTELGRREEALEQLLELDAALLPAIAVRLERLASKLDREQLKRQLQHKEDSSKRTTSVGAPSQDPFAARLARWLDERRPSEPGFAEGTEFLALCRMLTKLGSVEAARQLIGLYARMGEFLRIDVQRALSQMGDSGTAALIEARRHRAQKIADWAERQLDQSGKALPSAAIRTDSPQGLADILRALGRTRDPDAARIIISFANSERHQIRIAARQAIALLGEVGLWQLREAYENTVGKRPPRDWSPERIARELFSEHDRVRLARVERTFQEGLAFQARGDLAAMGRSFDAVLLRAPNYDKGAEMAAGYLAWGEQLLDRDSDQAELALARAERLATDAPTRERARSLRATLIARHSLKMGTVDTELMRTAAALDPTNAHVRRDLARLESEHVERDRFRLRTISAGAIGLLSLVGILVVLFRRRAVSRGGEREEAPSLPPASSPGGSDDSARTSRPRHSTIETVPTSAGGAPAPSPASALTAVGQPNSAEQSASAPSPEASLTPAGPPELTADPALGSPPSAALTGAPATRSERGSEAPSPPEPKTRHPLDL